MAGSIHCRVRNCAEEMARGQREVLFLLLVAFSLVLQVSSSNVGPHLILLQLKNQTYGVEINFLNIQTSRLLPTTIEIPDSTITCIFSARLTNQQSR